MTHKPDLEPYVRLMALVVLLGMISALVTFAFIALVHQGTHLLWTEAAQALGLDPRLFTVLVCTTRRCAGRAAGEAILEITTPSLPT